MVPPRSICIEIFWLEIVPSISTIAYWSSSCWSSRVALIRWKLFPTSPIMEASCKLIIVLFVSLRHGKLILKCGSQHSKHFMGSLGVPIVPFLPRFRWFLIFCRSFFISVGGISLQVPCHISKGWWFEAILLLVEIFFPLILLCLGYVGPLLKLFKTQSSLP